MIKKIISITLIVTLIFTTTNLTGLKVYAQGTMTNSSTVVDFDAIQNAATNKDDTDNDGVYDEVEKILGIDLNSDDTDYDGLDDYFELTNGLDPLKDDTNNDGVNDMYEVTRGEDVEPNISLDTDSDGNPNAFDDDNDDDGIPDYIDISPFASMGRAEKQELKVITDGNVTFVNIQIRPSDIEEIIEYGRSMTWPEDNKGQLQNIDDKTDNFNITPYLKIHPSEYEYNIDDETIEKYGYIKYGDYLYIPIETLEYDGNYLGYQGTVCLPKESGEKQGADKYINSFYAELSYLMTFKNDYIGQGMQTSGEFLDDTNNYEPLTLDGFDETRDRQFLNTSIGDIGNDGTLDLAVFYLESDIVDNGTVSITYDVYPDVYKRGEETYSYHSAPLLGQTFEINTGFTSVNKEDDGYTYMSRYDFDIVDGEIVCFYMDGKDTAIVYKATADGTITDTGISIENGERTYFYTEKSDSDFIGSNITDGAGYYANDTYFYLYSKENKDLTSRDATYLVVKKEGENQKEILVDYTSNLPMYKYDKGQHEEEDSVFADTELSNSLDIYDVNQDGKDDLVMLSYRAGTGVIAEYSRAYFISDIFGTYLDDWWEIVKELDVDICSNEGYARSMDICDIDGDDIMDMVVINANKEIEKQYETNEVIIGYNQLNEPIIIERLEYAGYDEMNLSFDIDVSYAIISREDILLSHDTEFEITGVNVETIEEVNTRIVSHEDDELMLGVSQAFEYEFLSAGKTINESINTVKDNMGFDEAGVDFTNDISDSYDSYDDALARIGKHFDDIIRNNEDETKGFVLGLEKKHQFKNLDELAVVNKNGRTTFDVLSTDTITTHEMNFKWIINNTLASPKDIYDMVDDNPDNIKYFGDYNEHAKSNLMRLNIGSTNITRIGDIKIEYVDDYKANILNPVYLSGKIPSSLASGYVFVATKLFVKEPALLEITYKTHRYIPGGGSLKNGDKMAQLSKYNKYKTVGKFATVIGTAIDVTFSFYNGYMYGQALKERGASDGTVAGAQTVYSLLYSAKAIITTLCLSIPVVGWAIWGLIMADMLVGYLTGGKYGGYVDKALQALVKSFYDYNVYEGTYISTFDIVNKDITTSQDGYFTWVNNTYNEYTEYKTIISAKDKESPANTEKKLDDCWVQIYDEFASNDASIENEKIWTEKIYKDDKKYRQRRYFEFDNTATFDEVGRNVLIENDVVYKYKIIEKVTVESDKPYDPFDEDKVTFYYSDKDKIYELYDRDLYFDILPTSFEVFFETYKLVDGLDATEKNELGCTDIDGDGLFVDKDGNEVDDDGTILTSDSKKFDTDEDGLSDYLEASNGSDPTSDDSDSDGLTDFEEFKLGTNLTKKDTDGDGIDDYTEVNVPVTFTLYGSISASGYSSPLFADTDGDLLSDSEERTLGTNPASIFTNGGELFDGNNGVPQLTTGFEGYYALTDGEELEINLNNHITDDNDLIFDTDYGTVDENGILTYTYDKDSDGTSFEISITASDRRNGILETSIMVCEDMDNPFITGIKLDNVHNDNITHIDNLAKIDSRFEIIFNEDVSITSTSAITITPIENKHLDVDSSANRLSNDCTVVSATSSSITVTRDDSLVENNITYRIDIHSTDIEDTNANLLDRDYEITFKMVDNISPEIISVSSEVGIDIPLEIEFNEPVYMKPTHVGGRCVRLAEGKSLYGYASDTTFTASIKPNYLDDFTSYTLDSNTNKFWDLSGNVFAGCDGMTSSHKTFTTSDVDGPYPTLNQFNLQSPVLQMYDYCFETNITGGEIRIPFDEDIKEGVDYGSIALSYENNLYFYGSDSAATEIKEEAKKYTLPYTSRIEGNTLVIIPDNYDSAMNYSVFVEVKSIDDLSGSYIRDIDEDYRLRILAKSSGVQSSTQDNSTNIVALYCTNNDSSKSNIVSNGLNDMTYYSDIINVVFNKLVVPIPMGSVNATLTNANGNTVGSNANYSGVMLTIMPTDTLSSGEYTISIPANTFVGVNDTLTYSFVVEDEISIPISEDDVLGTAKVDEKLFLSNQYLENALSQDKDLAFTWHRSDTDSFGDATPITGANLHEYTQINEDEGKYIFVSVQNNNILEVSPAIGVIESPYNNYCHIDNISVKYDETDLVNYDSNTFTYDKVVSSEKDKVYVTADFDESRHMNVYINGIKDTIWSEEGQMAVGLLFGNNEIIVESKAENNNDTKKYTINIFRDKTQGVENLKPSAENVSISNPSDNYLGGTLHGYYEYYDELNRQEGSSILKWYRLIEGELPIEIQNANNEYHTITEDDIGTKLMFSITPITNTNVTGEETCSNYSGSVTNQQQVIAVAGVSLDKTTMTLREKGATGILTATINPNDATNKNITWSSDDESIATVSESGVVTPISTGTANITVTTEDGGYTATSVVTVNARSTSGSSDSGSSSSSNSDSNATTITSSKKGVDTSITVSGENIEATFNGMAFDDLKNKKVQVKIEEVDKKDLELSSELTEQIGELPIYDISVFVDGKKTNFESDKPITIEIPVDDDYEGHKVVAIYIDDNGNEEIMEGVVIDGVMRFTTNHLSNYALIYVDKTFEDMKSHWGKEAVEALASREVINGKSETTFAPDDTIIMAEFITLMVRYFDLTSNSKLNYSDVEADMWYTENIAIAKDNGILPSIYGDTFEPNKAITREEMMYILYKSLEVTNKLDSLEIGNDKLEDFTDSGDMLDYAVIAGEYLISRDIINGSDNNMINSTNTSTRAEVAQTLYNLLIKLNNK